MATVTEHADGAADLERPYENLPNWFDGPVTLWVIVDGTGQLFPFGSQRAAADLLERWEERLASKGPYRLIECVERPRENDR